MTMNHIDYEPLVYTMEEAARLCRMSYNEFAARVVSGDIPSIQLRSRGKRRIPVEALKAWVASLVAITTPVSDSNSITPSKEVGIAVMEQ